MVNDCFSDIQKTVSFSSYRSDKLPDGGIDNADSTYAIKADLTAWIRGNLSLDVSDVAEWCRQRALSADEITQKGKNWYVYSDDCVITISAQGKENQ